MSTYKESLEPVVRQRYDEKIKEIDDIDPYSVPSSIWERHAEVKWPQVTDVDIYDYLVTRTSSYTYQQMKAYKSLEAYNYFISGFVLDMGLMRLDHTSIETANNNNRVVVLGSVKHSQRMSDSPLRPWVAIREYGRIMFAHCTCMAGQGEVCSHVAALLFAIQANSKLQAKTVTEEKCYWLPAAAKNVRSIFYDIRGEMNFILKIF